MAVKLFLELVKISVKRDITYKWDSILLTLFNFFIFLIQFLFFSFIFSSSFLENLLPFDHAMVLLASQQIIESLYYAFFFKSHVEMSNQVLNGKLDYFLTIPGGRTLLSHWETDLKELLTLPFPIFLLLKHSHFSYPQIFQYILLIALAFYIRVKFGNFISNLAIIFVKVFSLHNLEANLFSHSFMPSSIYKGLFKLVFTLIIPLGLVANLAYQQIFNRNINFTFLGLIAAFIFGILSEFLFKNFIKRYSSAGG